MVAIFSEGRVLTIMTQTYMSGCASFVQRFFFMFAQVTGDFGVAKVIDLKAAALVHKPSPNTSAFSHIISGECDRHFDIRRH